MAGYDAIEFIRIGGEMDDKGVPVEGSGRLAPVVREDRCVGCGLCQMRCHAINVKVKQLLEHSAIQVVAGAGREDRVMSGSYIALRDEQANQRKESHSGSAAPGEYLPDFLK
jgi:NAD-dependent dihydropyrimidine dehydrogenase PreA subunit